MKRRALIAVLVVVGLAAVGFAAVEIAERLVQMRRENTPPRPELYVQARYRAVRESPGHAAHVGVTDIECSSCHDPGDGGLAVPTAESCMQCHAEMATLHAGARLEVSGDDAASWDAVPSCLGCHRFTEDHAYEPLDCMRCHVQSHGDTVEIVQHSTTQCTGCHRPHESPALVAADCTECHEPHPTAHGAVESPDGCLTCHRSHDLTELASDRCDDCHSSGGDATRVSETSATFRGHDSCGTCHGSTVGAGPIRPCRSCHTGRHALAERAVPQHADCTSCHRPHAARASASGSCNRCHRDVRSDHPVAAGQCLSCHAAHPTDPAAIADGVAATCTSCHRMARNDPHAAVAGRTCTPCHTRHAFRVESPERLCESCHADVRAVVSRNEGHARCVSCHTAPGHRATARPRECAQCHAEEHRTAPVGHRQCATCHRPHDGALLERAACASCHATQPRSAHARHGVECASCHRPHGPAGVARPPACTSCHDERLPGLHRNDGHDTCLSCHRNHERAPRGDRATCLSCHRDQREHQADAQVCTGCHLFGGG